MVQPSPVLLARVRFTTKQVGFGFYRGNQTGSVGAHTQYGGYLVDWRKVRNYAVPDLKNFNLTPYVTREIEYKAEPKGAVETNVPEQYKLDPLVRRAMPFLASWRATNHDEFTDFVKHQHVPTERGVDAETQVMEEHVSRTYAGAKKMSKRTDLREQMKEKHRSLETAMKNTPREYQVGKTEKQKRSQTKALRNFVKKKEEQYGDLTPEIRHMKSSKGAQQQQREDAKRLEAIERKFRGPARQMAKKLLA